VIYLELLIPYPSRSCVRMIKRIILTLISFKSAKRREMVSFQHSLCGRNLIHLWTLSWIAIVDLRLSLLKLTSWKIMTLLGSKIHILSLNMTISTCKLMFKMELENMLYGTRSFVLATYKSNAWPVRSSYWRAMTKT
jgi:hypothetical protein